LDSPYKIKHWSPVKRVPIAYDVWYNPTEWEDIESEEQKCSSDFLYRTVKEKIFYFFKIVVQFFCEKSKHFLTENGDYVSAESHNSPRYTPGLTPKMKPPPPLTNLPFLIATKQKAVFCG